MEEKEHKKPKSVPGWVGPLAGLGVGGLGGLGLSNSVPKFEKQDILDFLSWFWSLDLKSQEEFVLNLLIFFALLAIHCCRMEKVKFKSEKARFENRHTQDREHSERVESYYSTRLAESEKQTKSLQVELSKLREQYNKLEGVLTSIIDSRFESFFEKSSREREEISDCVRLIEAKLSADDEESSKPTERLRGVIGNG